MKNLIYFICNEAFRGLLEYNLNNFLGFLGETTDVCIICPKDFKLDANYKLKNVFLFEQNEYDYVYTAKFSIGQWRYISNYKNILYVDVDAIIVNNPEALFERINSNHDVIHGVKEVENINNCINNIFFRNTRTIFPESPNGYNCGTFGFNIKMLEIVNELWKACDSSRENSLCDQPIYNEFLITRGLIDSTLSDYVYLMNDCYADINKITKIGATILHFLGNAYQVKNLDFIKETVNNIKRQNEQFTNNISRQKN